MTKRPSRRSNRSVSSSFSKFQKSYNKPENMSKNTLRSKIRQREMYCRRKEKYCIDDPIWNNLVREYQKR